MVQMFSIEVSVDDRPCKCFVQQLRSPTEEVFMISFDHSNLINRFNGKKLLLTPESERDETLSVFWNAIRKHQQRQGAR
ncbi:MAG TPA: hypothetical protein VGC95_04575 [Chitinophagaceae bacterium]|jgi:hypothetical protein